MRPRSRVPVARNLSIAVALAAVAAAALLAARQRPPVGPAPAPHKHVVPEHSYAQNGWNVLANPIDPAQQTDLPFGFRSHWLQPWRAYLDTPPASVLRNAVGINFNVAPQDAESTARLLAASGFTRARVEIGWSAMSYFNPSQLKDPAAADTVLRALKDAGIRPLILLNANDDHPGPAVRFMAHVTQPAPAGARSVQVGPATAQALAHRPSGFDAPNGTAAAFMVTAVSPGGLVQLSRPLPVAIRPGLYPARVLRYQPFSPPLTTSGQPNPAFQQTLGGWLRYVKAVTSEARKVLGNDQFDVEVWNELNFGSNFLNPADYYHPVPASLQGTGSTTDALLRRTVRWLRDPANGLPDVGIGDGFANQSPFVSGAILPTGVTAIDKHPYDETPYVYPQAQVFDKQRPVDALGNPAGSMDAAGNWHDSYIPKYTAYFPEYLLSGIQTNFLERDLSPLTTAIAGAPHGRSVRTPGASTPPKEWITETNVDLGPAKALGLTPADTWHLQAKATLRTLAAYVNKGFSAVYFYAVSNGTWAMLDPGAPGGGPTLTAVRDFLRAFAGPPDITVRRSLRLLQVADRHNWTQFAGNGTAAYPPLYNRDVVAFFPFQVSADKFVVPAYVMTRDLAKLYRPGAAASDVTRYDLPPETYRLVVGGLHTRNLRVTASDPLTHDTIPVRVSRDSSTTATLELPLTDYPRLITIQDG